jgi:hypothetical protein
MPSRNNEPTWSRLLGRLMARKIYVLDMRNVGGLESLRFCAIGTDIKQLWIRRQTLLMILISLGLAYSEGVASNASLETSNCSEVLHPIIMSDFCCSSNHTRAISQHDQFYQHVARRSSILCLSRPHRAVCHHLGSLLPSQHSQGQTRKPKHHIQETKSLRSIPSAA